MKHSIFPKLIFTLIFFLFTVVSTTVAQNGGENGKGLEETLVKLAKGAAKAYVSPIISPFGTNLNGGWFHSAPMAKMFGLKMELGLVGMGTFYPEDVQKNFDWTGQFSFNSTQAAKLIADSNLVILDPSLENALIDAITKLDFNVTIAGPTINGSSEEEIKVGFNGADVQVEYPQGSGNFLHYAIDPDDLSLKFGGLKLLKNFVPFLAPQATIGTILGTQATIRWLPRQINEFPLVSGITDDIGKFSWFGWGIQHNPGVFFPTPLPLDISAGYFKQTFKVGEIFKAETTAFGITVSKRLGIGVLNLTPYAGYLRESSKLHFKYQFILEGRPPIDIDFDFEGENRNRFTVGCSLRLLLFNINADYNMGKYKSATVGIMFAL